MQMSNIASLQRKLRLSKHLLKIVLNKPKENYLYFIFDNVYTWKTGQA